MSEHVWPMLFDGVAAVFTEDGVTAEHAFGDRKPMQQPATAAGVRAKISWVPGDDSGSYLAGKFGPPISPGQFPTRALGTLLEAFTIYLEAVDTSSPKARASDRASYAAVRTLLEVWYRAFYHTAREVGVGGHVVMGNPVWLKDKRVVPQGACLRILVSAPTNMPDYPVTIVGETSDAPAVAELGGSVTSNVDVDGNPVETQRTDEP